MKNKANIKIYSILEFVQIASKKLLLVRFVKCLFSIPKFSNNKIGKLVTVIVLGLFLYGISLGANELLNISQSMINFSTLFACFLIATSLGLVHVIFTSISTSDHLHLLDALLTSPNSSDVHKWITSFLSIPKQILFSFAIVIACVLSAIFLERLTTADFFPASYIIIFSCILLASLGLYIILALPSLASLFYHSNIRLHWQNPGDSPVIKVLSGIYNSLALASAIIASFFLIGMYWFRPWENKPALLVTGLFLLFAFSLVLYTWMYPYYYLSRSIKLEKYHQMEILNEKLVSLRENLETLKPDQQTQFFELSAIYKDLSLSKESTLNTIGLITVISSFLIPFLSFLSSLFKLKDLLFSFSLGY